MAVTFTNGTCGNNNGTTTIGAVTGGTAPYSYSFNGGTFGATTSFTSLAIGTYAVIIKDVNGCTFTTSVAISDIPGPTALATSSTNSTCGNANGTATIGAVTGGTSAYTYSFNGSGFSTTTLYSTLLAGTYPVIVKDANGCTFTTSVTVIDTPGPTALAVTTVNSTCTLANGVINIGAVTGGTSAYTYSVNGSLF
ncbi:MAG: adhesin, partial [Betaproteobacteria bacterium]|nr:adhesin [Betaproteobacteria bacterium]